MKNMLRLVSCSLLFLSNSVNAANDFSINSTNQSALLDGKCGGDEWEAATKFDLPAEASLHLMHDNDYFYLCAKGKAEDYTVLDLYIKLPQTDKLHKFHLSAQMGESIFDGNDWSPSGKWDLQDYAGFWAGREHECSFFDRGVQSLNISILR